MHQEYADSFSARNMLPEARKRITDGRTDSQNEYLPMRAEGPGRVRYNDGSVLGEKMAISLSCRAKTLFDLINSKML